MGRSYSDPNGVCRSKSRCLNAPLAMALGLVLIVYPRSTWADMNLRIRENPRGLDKLEQVRIVGGRVGFTLESTWENVGTDPIPWLFTLKEAPTTPWVIANGGIFSWPGHAHDTLLAPPVPTGSDNNKFGRHPHMLFFLYRQDPGNPTLLIGMSDLKHGFKVVPSEHHFFFMKDLDTYTKDHNKDRSFYGPIDEMNFIDFTVAAHAHLGFLNADGDYERDHGEPQHAGNPITHLLQTEIVELDKAMHPGAKYYLAGTCFVSGDANPVDNTQWVEICPQFAGGTFSFTYGTHGYGAVPGVPKAAIKVQVKYRLLGNVFCSRWYRPGEPGNPSARCWYAYWCFPKRDCYTRIVFCPFMNRKDRLIELPVWVPLTPWKLTRVIGPAWPEVFRTYPPRDLGPPPPPQRGLFGPPPDPAQLIDFAAPLPALTVLFSDDGGTSFRPGSDFTSAFFAMHNALEIDSAAMQPDTDFVASLKRMAPGYQQAADALTPLLAEVQDVLTNEDISVTGPALPLINQDLAQMHSALSLISSSLSTGSPADPAPFDTMGTALLDMAVQIRTFPSARYAHAADNLVSIARGFEFAADMIRGGLDEPLEQDFFLWGLRNRFQPMLAHFAQAMMPHMRVQVDLGDWGWFPSTIAGVKLRIQHRNTGQLLDEVILPLSDLSEFDVPLAFEEGTPLRLWFKLPTHLSRVVDLQAQDGLHVGPIPLIQGDVNGDNCVSSDDLARAQADQGIGGPTTNSVPPSDVNGDGIVNQDDLNTIQANLGQCGQELVALTGPDLSIMTTGKPSPVIVYKTLTYTLRVHNESILRATGVVVTDTLASTATFISATPNQGRCARNGAIVSCDLGSLLGGAEATVTIKVLPTITGPISNSASVSANEVDPIQDNNTTAVTVSALQLGVFLDTFETSTNSSDVNFENGERQGGTASVLGYLEDPATATGGALDALTQVNNPDSPGALRLNPQPGKELVAVSPNHNFVEGGDFTIQFEVQVGLNDPTGTSSDWAAVVFGAASQNALVNASDGMGILFRNNGQVEVWDGTTRVYSGDGEYPGGLPLRSIGVRIDVSTANFVGGSPATIRMIVNDRPVRLGSGAGLEHVKASGFRGNFITLEGYASQGNAWIHTFDNFSVSTTACVPGTCEGGFQLPGDCNQDGRTDLSDAICVLGYLFLGDPAILPCGDGTKNHRANIALLDWNIDSQIDLSDGVGELRFLFLGGPPHAKGSDCFEIAVCPEVCPGNRPDLTIEFLSPALFHCLAPGRCPTPLELDAVEQPFEVKYQIANRGEASSGRFTQLVEILDSSGSEVRRATSNVFEGLLPGQTAPTASGFSLFGLNLLPPDRYVIRLVADFGEEVRETNEDDNVSQLNITVVR